MPPSDTKVAGKGLGSLPDDDRGVPSVESVMQPDAFTMFSRRVIGHRSFMVAAIIMITLVIVALFAPVLAPHDPLGQDLDRRLMPPV